MLNVLSRALICLSVFLASPTTLLSQELTVTQILNDPKRVRLIDRLSREDRRLVLRAIRNELGGSSSSEMVKLLCQIDTWSLGDALEDARMQNEILKLPVDLKPWSADFRAIDCAAANREGSFYSLIPAQRREMRDAFLDGNGKDWSINKASSALTNIRIVDGPLLTGTRGRNLRSFFPLFNVQHATEILAAEAVASVDDEAASIRKLQQAVKIVDDWLRGNPQYFKRSRNGYRYHNDLVFLKNFYLALSGEQLAIKELRELSEWPALLSDSEVNDILPSSLPPKIRGDDGAYIDPIYFGRLLPGAATNLAAEQDRWWLTHYPTREIGNLAVWCFEQHFRKPYAERLFAMDECLANYDPSIWRVELSSFRGSSDQLSRAEDELNRLMRHIFRNGNNAAVEQYREDFKAEFVSGRWYIRTDRKYSRRQITLFRNGLENVSGIPSYTFSTQNVH